MRLLGGCCQFLVGLFPKQHRVVKPVVCTEGPVNVIDLDSSVGDFSPGSIEEVGVSAIEPPVPVVQEVPSYAVIHPPEREVVYPELKINELKDKSPKEIVGLLISRFDDYFIEDEVILHNSRAIEFLFRLAEADSVDFDACAKGKEHLDHGGMGSTDIYWNEHYKPCEVMEAKHCNELYNLLRSLSIDEETAVFAVRNISGKDNFRKEVVLKVFIPESEPPSCDEFGQLMTTVENFLALQGLPEDDVYRFVGAKRNSAKDYILHHKNSLDALVEKVAYLVEIMIRHTATSAIQPMPQNETFSLSADFTCYKQYSTLKNDHTKTVAEAFIGQLKGLHQNNFTNRLHVAEFFGKDLAAPNFIKDLTELTKLGVHGTLDLFNKANKLFRTYPDYLYGLFYEATTALELIQSLNLNPNDVTLSEYRKLSRKGNKLTDIDISLPREGKRFDIELKSTVKGISDHDLDEILYMAKRVDNPVLLPLDIGKILGIANENITADKKPFKAAFESIITLNNLIEDSNGRLKIWNAKGVDLTDRVKNLKTTAGIVLGIAA